MKTTILVEGEIDLSYNPNDPEFKQAFEDFKVCYGKESTINEMLKHVAFYVTRFGTEGMVEGVGYVGFNGKKPTEEPYSGIMVGEDYDDFEFTIE